MPESPTDSPTTPQKMPIIGHFKELRKRVLYACLSVLIVFLGLFPFANDIYTFFSLPVSSILPENTSMIALDVTAAFFAPFKLTLAVSFILALPFVLFQLWAFIAPALYKNEKIYFIPLIFGSLVLFLLGMAFAYYVTFPLLFGFFVSIAPEGVQVAPDINVYLSLIIKLFIVFGLSFETPIVVMLLVASGVVEIDKLKGKRPYVIIVCFTLGMLLTPPDIISQTILAIPMWLLFEVGLLLSKLLVKKPQAEASPE